MTDALVLGLGALVVLIALIAIRMPIAYAMILVGGVGTMMLNRANSSVCASVEIMNEAIRFQQEFIDEHDVSIRKAVKEAEKTLREAKESSVKLKRSMMGFCGRTN